MSRDRVRRRRRDAPQPPQPLQEPDTEETRRPLYRIKLSESVRRALASNVVVDVEVCASGEPCARAGHCGNPAHVRVIVRGGGGSETCVLCADHWLAAREVYDAMAGGRVRYGPGAVNLIAMRRSPHLSELSADTDEDTSAGEGMGGAGDTAN
jgi:hypothetical protein